MWTVPSGASVFTSNEFEVVNANDIPTGCSLNVKPGGKQYVPHWNTAPSFLLGTGPPHRRVCFDAFGNRNRTTYTSVAPVRHIGGPAPASSARAVSKSSAIESRTKMRSVETQT